MRRSRRPGRPIWKVKVSLEGAFSWSAPKTTGLKASGRVEAACLGTDIITIFETSSGLSCAISSGGTWSGAQATGLSAKAGAPFAVANSGGTLMLVFTDEDSALSASTSEDGSTWSGVQAPGQTAKGDIAMASDGQKMTVIYADASFGEIFALTGGYG